MALMKGALPVDNNDIDILAGGIGRDWRRLPRLAVAA